MIKVTIRPEAAADLDAIQTVHFLAFGRDEEARLVTALHAEGHARESLVAESEDGIIGHILFSDLPILMPERVVPALALAPLAVVPEKQRQGVGSALVRKGLQFCRASGHRIVVVLGHPGFYPRFGFSAELAERLRSPYSGEAFMAMELVPGALNGVEGEVCYPPPFGLFSP
jgi:putative acetyltransferase